MEALTLRSCDKEATTDRLVSAFYWPTVERITRPTASDLASLRSAWRTERAAEERAAGIPAIGTAEWHRQYADAPADPDAPTPDANSPVTAGTLADAVGVSS